MEVVTDKWGIRINRIEIVEITPPPQILQALALQKQADQEKRARILQSEGQQQSAVNVADGNGQAAIKTPRARGRPPSSAPRATGKRRSSRPRAAPRPSDGLRRDQGGRPEPDPVRDPPARYALKFAASENAKIVVPDESSALLGAAQVLRSVLADAPTLGGGTAS